MFLADYHTHSRFSSDGHESAEDMLAAAQKIGLSELCVTDHCDMWDPGFPSEERAAAFDKTRAQNSTGVKLLLGIELGEGIHNKPLAERRVTAAPYDFIIGSYHALSTPHGGAQDFYHIRYNSEEQCHRLLAQYFTELNELAEWGRFDVVGHLDYPLRYMLRDGFEIDLLPRYENELRALFAILTRKGLGIELNTKGPFPFGEILSLYRRCGGEIVTVGSDAHRARDIGRGVPEGLELCRRSGFTHVAAFDMRRVRYEKI